MRLSFCRVGFIGNRLYFCLSSFHMASFATSGIMISFRCSFNSSCSCKVFRVLDTFNRASSTQRAKSSILIFIIFSPIGFSVWVSMNRIILSSISTGAFSHKRAHVLCPITDDIHVIKAEYIIFEQIGKNKRFADTYGMCFCTGYIRRYITQIHTE